MTDMSRLSVFQAAFVVARRDFFAILLSKAFLFFLLGPIFFGAISVGAGFLGAKAADSAAPPRLGVMLAPAENDAVTAAARTLSERIDLPELDTLDGSEPAQDVLGDDARNLGAVLTGSFAAPHLVGPREQIERWQGRVSVLLQQAGAPDAGAGGAFPDIALVETQSSMADTRNARTATATGGITLLFLLTMLLAGMVLSNLVEEKANKIIEILAASIPMDAVFMGKLFAMLAISVVGLAVWGVIGGAVLFLGSEALPALPEPGVGWPLFIVLFLVYFALAYLLIGSVFLTVGSMAATVRDVQTLSMPATILQLAVFFLSTFAMTDPGSTVELFAVVFPLSSPYAMLARAAQLEAVWPHLVAIAWQVVWVALFVKLGAMLFRRRVMKSGPSQPRGATGPKGARAA